MADGGGFATRKRGRSKAARAALHQLSRVIWEHNSLRQVGPEYWRAWRDHYLAFKDWPSRKIERKPMSDEELKAFMDANGYLFPDDPKAKALYDEYHELIKEDVDEDDEDEESP